MSNLHHTNHLLIAIALAGLALVPATLRAQPTSDVFRDACRAEVRGDHASAFHLYERAAQDGLREAIFALGRHYRDGLGTVTDAEAAFEWFRKAAERGHLLARYQLGLAYRDGQGVEKNVALAREWLESAALRHGPAAFAVFQLEQDPQERTLWLRHAAEEGHSPAMRALSQAYASGEYGLATSLSKSRRWKQRAAETDPEQPQR